MHYYKFNIKDWSRDTAHLTVEEEGVYRRLLDQYYESETPIPKETQLVIRRLRLSGYEMAVSLILEEFFTLGDDGYRHARCDSEIEKYHAKAQANRANGKSGGRPKKPSENPDGYQEEPSRNLNHKPLTINQEQEDQKPLSPSAPAEQKPERKDPAFARILEIYGQVCKGHFKGAATITAERRKNITKCWNRKVNGVLVFQSGKFWTDYFTWCLRDPHWCGETGTWKASLEFVTKPTSVDRILDEMTLEGVFTNEPA